MALPDGLWRTTTFRLSALFGAIYAAGIVLLLGLVYAETANYLTRRADAALYAQARNLERSGPEGVLRRLRLEGAKDPLSHSALFSAFGQRIVGDADIGPPELPVDGRIHAVGPAPGRVRSRALAERAPWGEIVVVERDTRQLGELRLIVLRALILSGAVIVLLGLTLGLALSLDPLRRIAAIRQASQAIGRGEFGVRLPIGRERDEIDELAGIANSMMDEAARLMAQARSVGEGVAHELRSPLTRLRARLEHAATALPPGDERRDLLASAVTEADQVLGRFQALLRIAALEARGRRTGLGVVALDALAAQALELFLPLAKEHGVSLELRAPKPLQIEADGELLFEAICNLIDNAIKFTPQGGRVRLEVGGEAQAPWLEVCDTGPGIPEAERSLVVRRFWRGGGHSGVPGFGLGLSLVAAVADLHGFDLTFHDAGPGACVRLGRSADARGTTERG